MPHYLFYKLSEYNVYYNHGKINKADGIVVYIKKTLNESTEVVTIDNVSFLDTVIKLNNSESIKFTSIYRCHSLKKTDFINIIQKIIRNNLKFKNHCIVGDFNINIFDNDKLTNEYLSNFSDGGYCPYFSGITRPNGVSGSCIDNFFIKTSFMDVQSYKLMQEYPDYPLFLSIKIDKTINTVNYPNTFIDFKMLQRICYKIDWYESCLLDDPDTATSNLVSKMQNCLIKATKKIKDS